MENKFPDLTKLYGVITGAYLKAMPKQMRDKLLEEDKNEPTTPTADVAPTQK